MLGKNLSVLRKNVGLTQSGLAEVVGVSRERIKNLEKSSNATLDLIEKYFSACGKEPGIGIFTEEKKHLITLPLENIVKSLIRLRKITGMTQEQLAEKLRTSRSRIAQLETGTDNMTIKTVFKYIHGCGFIPMISMKK